MTVAALPAAQRRFVFASSRAPEQERRCPHHLRRPSPARRAHATPLACSPPKTLVVFAPDRQDRLPSGPRRHTGDPSATLKSP